MTPRAAIIKAIAALRQVGVGASCEIVENLIIDRPDVLALWCGATKQKAGNPNERDEKGRLTPSLDNIQERTKAPTGTSAQAGMRRLQEAAETDPLPEPVRCTPQTARKFMAISSHQTISNRAHMRDLPGSWGTLYELTKLPDDKLEIALSEGWVRPEMQRGDVKATA
ncbi:MAG: hypothetical protein AB7U61_04560 [Methylocystis sp.]